MAVAGNQSLIFTYGTLKRGFPNHGLMEDMIGAGDAVYLGRYATNLSFPLVCGPYGIPFLINLPGQGHRVSGELFSVSPRGLCRADELEGTTRGHYERLPIQIRCIEKAAEWEHNQAPIVQAEAYFAHRSYAEGMWMKKERAALSEYTESHGREYVKPSDRPENWSFVGAIQAFVGSSD